MWPLWKEARLNDLGRSGHLEWLKAEGEAYLSRAGRDAAEKAAREEEDAMARAAEVEAAKERASD